MQVTSLVSCLFLNMDGLDKNLVWHRALESLKVSVSPAIFSTWFSQTHISEVRKTGERFVVEIGCSSFFVKTTVENRYFGLVQDVLNKELNTTCDLIFSVKQVPLEEKSKDLTFAPLFDKKVQSEDEFRNALTKSGLRPSFNFDDFAVSSSNQMAWAAAEAVSKNPGTSYNPLFIWGGVGVGKTHLMSAIGYTILKETPNEGVLLCTGEEFTNDIVEGIRNKTTQAFRRKYRKLKVLLIDDIQFIAGKDAVQEEFFHTFNALVGSGSQIIMTSDKPPSEISKLEERLRSRFEAGLIVDIAPPDFELRCAITQIKTSQRNMDLPMDIVQVIAANLDSARKIEGFLIKLLSELSLKKTVISKDVVESLLGKGIDTNNNSVKANPNDVLNAVSKYYSIGKRSLLGSSRSRPIARPRQILMYLLRIQLSLPLEEIGRIVGNRDHTTVMHAVETITNLSTDNAQIREDIQGIKNSIWGQN